MCFGEYSIPCALPWTGVDYSKGVVTNKPNATVAELGLPPQYIMLRAHVRLDGVSIELKDSKTVRFYVCAWTHYAVRVSVLGVLYNAGISDLFSAVYSNRVALVSSAC